MRWRWQRTKVHIHQKHLLNVCAPSWWLLSLVVMLLLLFVAQWWRHLRFVLGMSLLRSTKNREPQQQSANGPFIGQAFSVSISYVLIRNLLTTDNSLLTLPRSLPPPPPLLLPASLPPSWAQHVMPSLAGHRN